jgi:hypothetical protein
MVKRDTGWPHKLTNARLAREHHSMLQRLWRLQSMGIYERVVNVQADEMPQTMRHEQTMQIESKGIFGAASHEASRNKIS